MPDRRVSARWLNATVLGIGLASLFSDWSHEMATTILPAFLASMGAAAFWLGLIEGMSDGISSFGKLASGHWTDRLRRRKPIMVIGYAVTTAATASFAVATSVWQVFFARVTAWLGRGVRTPVRKTILASAVTPATYGRAFGLERMMDTLGAIVGPSTAFALLEVFDHRYGAVFLFTLLPGLGAVACVLFLVRERKRVPVAAVSFRDGIRRLPARYRRLLAGVAMFGLGDFSHTLLILYATQALSKTLGTAEAVSAAIALYVAHNIFYAGFAFLSGWLADRTNKPALLSVGYLLAALMATGLVILVPTLWSLPVLFVAGGIYVGLTETLEDSVCAELVPAEAHGMAFGVLASVNGVGDFVSSVIVGTLWSLIGPGPAFAWSAALSLAGAIMVFSLGRARADGDDAVT